METTSTQIQTAYRHSIPKIPHSWLRKISLAYLPGKTTPLLDRVANGLLGYFRKHGHTVQPEPQGDLDVLLTTASFGEPMNWREALFFTARRRFGLSRIPLLYTLIHATPAQVHHWLARFRDALRPEHPDPEDFEFPGLAPQAYHTLYEQGCRGGPILSLMRMLQSQSKSIRILLVIGEDDPLEAYTFDLVGAFPRSQAADIDAFYEDLALRILTVASTDEVTEHEMAGNPILQEAWQALSTPSAMRKASLELGNRSFFTEMVSVASLVDVPVVHNAISRQYSEGCFATWDPSLNALVSSITGSARPVDKDHLSDDDLAVITGVRLDGCGALYQPVDGKRNDPPSSEAVELMQIDLPLPRIELDPGWDIPGNVPVARSKLHGHRGVKSYDPRRVEHVFLDPPYYHYPVSCSTAAQARGIQSAFARSQALQDPSDPRQIVFTVLPGHGVMMVEKWVQGKAPFQTIWEAMDEGALVIDAPVPQGPFDYLPTAEGRMALLLLPPQDRMPRD